MIVRIIRRFFRKKKENYSLFIQASSSSILKGSKVSFHTANDKRNYVTVGEKCIISSEFIFETSSGEVKIGNNVHIGGATFISKSSITIGNDVTMAWGITIYDHNSHSIHWGERQNDNKQCYEDYVNFEGNNIVNKDWTNVRTTSISIKDKVWIGFGVTILKGVTIGEGAVVGACSVVTKDVPSWTVVAGNPAVVVKKLKEDQ